MYERFTDRARKVMQLANQEAQRFNHEYIGTEHVLLGLVAEGNGVAAHVLKNLGVDLRKVRIQTEKLIQSGPDRVTLDMLPQTPRVKSVIRYAMEEAHNLNHNYVGTEHLLLGLLREEEGVAAQVLLNLGLKLTQIRAEVLNLLGIGLEGGEGIEPSANQPTERTPLGANLAPEDDAAWGVFRKEWDLPPDVVFLNHGSFGLPPRCVVAAQRRWLSETARNPMELFVDRYEGLHATVCDQLADFVGAPRSDIVLVENATYGMNVVARSFTLSAGDEVLINDHEYGAVKRIWQRACARAGAKLVEATLPLPVESAEQVTDAIFASATERTRLIVVSHVTSPTALTLPVAEICRRAAARGIRTCIDGPHAVAALPLSVAALGCDYYTASCHKWLSGPHGTGFLYVRPELQSQIEPPIMGWGRVRPGEPETWQEWFIWLGTRDVSPILALPVAINFIERIGLEPFRARTHHLARYARTRLLELPGATPIYPENPEWYGPMVAVRHPHPDANGLRQQLRKHYKIETVVSAWQRESMFRVSCHLYTQPHEIDRLIDALKQELVQD